MTLLQDNAFALLAIKEYDVTRNVRKDCSEWAVIRPAVV